MEKTKNIPKIRFKGYKDEWEKKELGTLIKLNGRIGFRGYTRKDIISKEDGGVLAFSPTNIIGNKLTVKCNNTYITRYKYNESPEIKVYNNDILFVKTGSTLGKSALVNNLNEDATINPQIVVIRAKKCDERFLSASLTTIDVLEQVNAVKIGGAIPTLNEEKIKEIKVILPKNKEEQKQIGDLFYNLNEKLEIEREKHEKLVNFKKAMLENVFPKEGEKRPKIRFGGYNDDWEEKRLVELLTNYGSGGTPLVSKKEYYDGDILFLNISDISESSGTVYKTKKTISEEGLKNSAAWIVPKGSISLAMYASVGKVAILGKDIATSQAFFNMVLKQNYDKYYIFTLLKKAELKNEWLKIIETGSQPNLNANYVKNFKVLIPSINEQKLIGAFFKNLDEKIQVSEEKISKIENFKKAMMEAMFV